MSFCYGTLFSMHDVMECILLTICNFHVLCVESVLPILKSLGGIKCCVRFSLSRDLVMTILPV